MNYQALVQSIAALHAQSVDRAVTAVNQTLVLRNWAIGAYIIEFEQNGEDRAKYGQGLLRRLSSDLSACGLEGVSPDMLERMRLFVRRYPQIANAISAPLARIFPNHVQQLAHRISAPVRKSIGGGPAPLPAEKILCLSWTHLADLVRIDDPWKPAFYEIECLNGGWSKRQLQRQIGSLLYERTALSSDKAVVIERARRQSTETAVMIQDACSRNGLPEPREVIVTQSFHSRWRTARLRLPAPQAQERQRTRPQRRHLGGSTCRCAGLC